MVWNFYWFIIHWDRLRFSFRLCDPLSGSSLWVVDSGFHAIPRAMDRLPRLLGKKLRFTLVSIHLPLLKSSLMTASLIVFVEVMKELPATLILRLFGVETLATNVYQYASSEQLAPASPAALLIVFVGVWPVLLINHMFSKKS